MLGEFDGKMWQGQVTGLNGNEKQVCLRTDVQEFWFSTDQLYPFPLSDDALQILNFNKQVNEDGSVKIYEGVLQVGYSKG